VVVAKSVTATTNLPGTIYDVAKEVSPFSLLRRIFDAHFMMFVIIIITGGSNGSTSVTCKM
jgi:hypothetical protein